MTAPYNEFWTLGRDQRLRELFCQYPDGPTLLEIGRELGCSLSYVRRRLGELRETGYVGYRKTPRRDQRPRHPVARGERRRW